MFHIGIDLHKKFSHITIMDNQGDIINLINITHFPGKPVICSGNKIGRFNDWETWNRTNIMC